MRIDPRHTFLLYSDKTTKEKQDFLIIGIKDLFLFFKKKTTYFLFLHVRIEKEIIN